MRKYTLATTWLMQLVLVSDTITRQFRETIKFQELHRPFWNPWLPWAPTWEA